MKQNQDLMMAVGATAVIMTGVGFFGGIKYQQSKQASFPGGQMGNTPGQMMGENRLTNGAGKTQGQGSQGINRPVMGEIISQDENSITVKVQDGSSKIVILSDSTKVNKSTEAAVTDLTVGVTVNVMGETNTDGSVTAQSIELNPAMRAAD